MTARFIFPDDAGASEASGADWAAPEVQMTELAKRLKSIRQNLDEEWDYGQLVTYKPGLGPMLPQYRQKVVFAFFRWLDLNDSQDRQLARGRLVQSGRMDGNRFDCLVAMLSSDSATISFEVMDSSLLQKADPEYWLSVEGTIKESRH
jgi:hypothetical protein